MILDSLKKIKLEAQLSALDRNFFECDPTTGAQTRIFMPPSLDEMLTSYFQSDELKQKISEMLAGDSIKRLYAGILLSAVDKITATNILKSLIDDPAQITIQKSVGFGLIECSIKILARDLLTQETIYGNNFAKAEELSNWALAVSMEKSGAQKHFNEASLPKWEDALEARGNPQQQTKLRIRIDQLKAGNSVAEKLYAAVLLDSIDKEESRKLLGSLLNEKTKVSLLSGDQMNHLEVNQLAEQLLNRESLAEPGEIKDPIARAFKWLSKTFAS